MAAGTMLSFGISALGHVLNRTGGRGKVTPSLVNTKFIGDQIGNIEQQTGMLNDKMMQSANANLGFQNMAMGREAGMSGRPAAANMMSSMGMQGREQANMSAMQNTFASQQNINSLLGMQAQMEQFNAQARNNAAATNFGAARADNNNFFNTLMAGGLQAVGQRYDQNRFNQTMAFQQAGMKQNKSMFDAYMASLNQAQQAPSAPVMPPQNDPKGYNPIPWGF